MGFPTRIEQRPSGLVVVAKDEPPPKPKSTRKLGPLEIQDPERRAKAIAAMDTLWHALGIGEWRPIGIDLMGLTAESHAAHVAAYEYFGGMLLGPDLPDHEIKT